MRNFVRIFVLCALSSAAFAATRQPKLLLTVVIDQFRFDYLRRFRADYNSGFVRLLNNGAVFVDAHHIHFPTVTAIGHSTVLTGATPSATGIAGNEWFDRATGKVVTSVSDPSTTLLGGPAGKTGSSPHRLLVSTVADELKLQGRETHVVGVSIKDRSAILPAGRAADAAYWFDSEAKVWVTSSYYANQLPAWVAALNEKSPAARIAGAKWMPLDGKGPALCKMGGAEDKIPACRSIEASPWGNELIEEFAERALVEEKLGKHSATDVLTVSFSSNDYVGHAYGPDAPEVRDISIRTDRLLGKLLDFVDRQVGVGNTLVVLTADHGVAPAPEANAQRRLGGGRFSLGSIITAVNQALSARFGEGKWVESASGMSFYLNRGLIKSKKLDAEEVEQAAAAAAAATPHIARVFTRHQLTEGDVPNDFVARAVSYGFHAVNSGDVFLVQEANYLFEGTSGTSHGTPYNYDTHVPVIFMGPGIKPGEYRARAAVVDIAPTLSALLGVEYPSGSIGRILSEALLP